MTDSSTSTNPDSGSGASTTASNEEPDNSNSIVGTARSIPVSALTSRDNGGMVDLDDALDDPTMPYREQIVSAVARIDEALPTTTRDLIPGDEVQGWLLDIRNLLA